MPDKFMRLGTKRSRIAATLACSSVSNIVSPPSVSVKSACSALASRVAQLSQLISGESYRSIPMKSPLNAMLVSTRPAYSQVFAADEN